MVFEWFRTNVYICNISHLHPWLSEDYSPSNIKLRCRYGSIMCRTHAWLKIKEVRIGYQLREINLCFLVVAHNSFMVLINTWIRFHRFDGLLVPIKNYLLLFLLTSIVSADGS